MPLKDCLKNFALLVAITLGLAACDAPQPIVKLTIIAEENFGSQNGGATKVINVIFNAGEAEADIDENQDAILDLKIEQITYLEVLGSAQYFNGAKDIALKIKGGQFKKRRTDCNSLNTLQGCVGRFGTLASIQGGLNFPTGNLITPEDQKLTIAAMGVFDDGEGSTFNHQSPKITIVGRAPPEPRVNLSVSQSIIRKGRSVDLSWNTSNTDKLNLSSAPVNTNLPGNLSQPNSRFGPITVSPGKTTRYVLSGMNKFYKNPAISAKEVVVYELYDDPRIEFFSAPAKITRGNEVKLRWRATGASDVKMVRTSPQSPVPKTIPIPLQSGYNQTGSKSDILTASGLYTYSLTASNPAFIYGVTIVREVFVEKASKCRTFSQAPWYAREYPGDSNEQSSQNLQSRFLQDCAWEYRN